MLQADFRWRPAVGFFADASLAAAFLPAIGIRISFWPAAAFFGFFAGLAASEDCACCPTDRRSGMGSHGVQKVSRNLLRWFGAKATLVVDPVGAAHDVLAFTDGALYAVIRLDVHAGAIRSLHVITDPAQLGAWQPSR